MFKYEQEWHYRKVVMEAILDVLSDGKPRTAWQILHSLPSGEGFKANKHLVNSILYSEAKRYVFRDNNSYSWRLRPADETKPILPPWGVVRDRAQFILEMMGRLTVNELMEALEDEGVAAPKWMVSKVVADDSFQLIIVKPSNQRASKVRK